ncbi:MAG: VCBS domain-containing protein [Sphingorhabdus sp.]
MEIFGTTGNDTLNGSIGDDVIDGNGGVDVIHAGDGDDAIVLDAPVGAGSTLDGGLGYDTLVLKPQAGTPYFNGGTSTLYNAYFPTVLGGIEAVQFDSAAGDFLGLVVLDGQRAASGLTNLTGGAGRDAFYDVVFQPGTYTMPQLSFTNWSSDIHDLNSDFVTLFASSAGNYVLNAREGLAAIQGLQGNVGDDILNGSSGSDALNGMGGFNQLYGNGGDDLLFAENPTPFGGIAGNLTFAGNIFDGGSGEDSLLVGGRVDFQGTLLGIENVYFEVSSSAAAPGATGLDRAYLMLSGSNALSLPAGAKINGNGTLEINLGAVTSFSAAGFQIGASYAIDLKINGTGGNDTIAGSSTTDAINSGDGDDTLDGGAGNDNLDGGTGTDTAVYSGNIADYQITALAPHLWQVTDLNTTDGDDGTDLLIDAELLQFVDGMFTLNQAPVALDLAVDLDEDVPAEGQVSATDLENQPIIFSLVQGPGHGSVSLNPDGTFLYTPAADYFGSDSFTFSASDGTASGNTGVVSLTIAPVDNDPAVITGDLAAQISEGTDPLTANGTVSGQLTASDPDGPTVFAADALAGTWGSFQFAEDGRWTYELADDDPFIGALNVADTVTDAFVVATADGSSQTVTITIQGANDAAVIGGATSGTVAESSVLNGFSQVTGTLSISDVDNLAQFAAANSVGVYGTFTLTAAGSWTYVLNNANAAVDGLSNGQSLGESFTVYAADGTAQVIELTIAGADDNRTGSNNAETLTGTSGNDTLNGRGGNDSLVGGLGNDALNGGTGTDTASYAGLAGGVTVSLAISGAQNTGSGGIDTLVAIENLTGTSQADSLTGNGGVNVLNGGDGNDVLDGGGGSDTLSGGNGIDMASYASAGSAVRVSLAVTAAQNTGGSGNDTLSSIENLFGSSFADTLIGNSGTNAINGGGGNDRITGGAGADQLTGGVGNDTFVYSATANSTMELRDLILDFQGAGVPGGDVFDFSAIDATPGGRDNAFVWGNKAATSHGVWYDYDAATNTTHIYADTDGNVTTAEMAIDLFGNVPLSSTDFFL